MSLQKQLLKEKEIHRIQVMIDERMKQAQGITGYPITIAELNVLYYTAKMTPETKQRLQAILETVETYYWYLKKIRSGQLVHLLH